MNRRLIVPAMLAAAVAACSSPTNPGTGMFVAFGWAIQDSAHEFVQPGQQLDLREMICCAEDVGGNPISIGRILAYASTRVRWKWYMYADTTGEAFLPAPVDSTTGAGWEATVPDPANDGIKPDPCAFVGQVECPSFRLGLMAYIDNVPSSAASDALTLYIVP